MDEQEPSDSSNTPSEECKPTCKGKKRLQAFSIQKKPASPVSVPMPKPICTTVGAVGTVFIGKLASAKPSLKPGDIEEVVDPKKPPKPPKPGTSKQNADYLNSQKKTLSEIEAMKRKMELVDLGIPLGLICPAADEKAMPTKAMPPIKSMMLDPAKVDEIIREAKKARAEGRTFKFSYQKVLPTYQNPFARNKQRHEVREDREAERDLLDDIQQHKERKVTDKYRRYHSIGKIKKTRDRQAEKRRRIIREREEKIRNRKEAKPERIVRVKEEDESKEKVKSKERDVRSKDKDFRSKEKDESSKELKSKVKDSKSKDKIDTINLSDVDDDDVEFVKADVVAKETDVNLTDYVICDSWSETEENNDSTEAVKKENDESKTTTKPKTVTVVPMKQLKVSQKANSPDIVISKLMPVTDSLRFEIDDASVEALDIFSETANIEDFAKIPLPAQMEPYSPTRFNHESKDISVDGMDESFLESVIAEIRQDDIDENVTQEKGLVEYDMSPKEERESVTPEIDDKIRELYSSRSDYSDGLKSVESVKSTESGCKSTESGYKSTESGYKLNEISAKSTDSNGSNDRRSKSSQSHKSDDSRSKSVDSLKSTENSVQSVESDRKLVESDRKSTKAVVEAMPKTTVASLETWSFVLKICQPLLFRHDRNKCYKETQQVPKIWFAENPKSCKCVKDRSVVYKELEMCKMGLVHNVYKNDRVQDDTYPAARGWYPASPLCESGPIAPASEWEVEDSQERPTPPPARRPRQLDLEYQKFMEAVLEVAPVTSETPPKTPVREVKKRSIEDTEAVKKKKPRIDSEGWSQESEVEVETQKIKKHKDKVKRKRKYSTDADSEETPSKKKKKEKKEKRDKSKSKALKRRLGKKYLKKLKQKQEKLMRKKKRQMEEEADIAVKEKKKRDKKLKKKKLLNQKKKSRKRKKSKTSTETSSESDRKSKKKDKRRKRKKRKQSTSESNQSDEFDVNILKNIKTERLTDDETKNLTPMKHREIINVKQLQNDFVSIQIKKEVEDVNSSEPVVAKLVKDEEGEVLVEEKKEMLVEEKKEMLVEEKKEMLVEKNKEMLVEEKKEILVEEKREPEDAEENEDDRTVEEEVIKIELLIKHDDKEPDFKQETVKPPPDETTQSSSQDSVISVKEYEKDESHLRPSSQNSNYNFHDVMQSEGHDMVHDGMQSEGHDMERAEEQMDLYQQGYYEMYEQMAMEYQSDVASQRVPPPDEQTSGRIETVALTHSRGEIKCDWRAGDPPEPAVTSQPSRWAGDKRPSRWGLKPSEVNIVLTGGNDAETSETFPIESVVSPTVYKIQSLANSSNSGYDEAYMDTYGAADRLLYGDCFSAGSSTHHSTHSSLDERINQVLNANDIGDVAEDDTERDDGPDKGILVTKALMSDPRCAKRVSFADGYKPGQDSDTEEPPVIKRKKIRRLGCPWPCPLEHPDHVPLWDALPPPPPPGSPPPPQPAPLPAHLLREGRRHRDVLQVPMPMGKYDQSSLVGFMPPEPPPGLISF